MARRICETDTGVPIAKSGTPGHPARGRYLSRQVSWLAGHHRRPSSRGVFLSDISGRQLSAYSCGGSSGMDALGIVTVFPLSSGPHDPQNHDTVYNGGKGRNGQSHKEIFMWRVAYPLALCGTKTSAFRLHVRRLNDRYEGALPSGRTGTKRNGPLPSGRTKKRTCRHSNGED